MSPRTWELGSVVVVALACVACSASHAPEDDASASADAAVVRSDAWIDPLQVGQVATSCGAASQGLVPVDCTREGDLDAYCVFGNHCACTTGFVCERPGMVTGAECAPGAVCLPAP